jgi:hypothetical protein
MSREQGSRLRDATGRECRQSPTRSRMALYELFRGDAQ